MRNRNSIVRMLCLLLALCLSLSTWPTVAFAAETGAADVAIDAANFPDDAFRTYVKQFDLDQNGTLSENELASVDSIDVISNGTKSLKGIEYFTALKGLYCEGNQLTTLDVSKNIALESLDCSENQLTALDVSKNTTLVNLVCDRNQLTVLDLSKSPALTNLYCYSNQLTTLDVSKNTALHHLECYDNQLTALDLSKNTALVNLYCWYNQLTTLDVSKNTALQQLDCYNNQLTALDLSKNTVLESLDCGNNQLKALDLSQNKELQFLFCSRNHLSSLDLSNNPKVIHGVRVDENAYMLPQGINFDYTTLPGAFDVNKVSDVVGGSFNKENHTFSLNSGKTSATYTYDMGYNLKATFTLHINPYNDVKEGSYYHDSVLWAMDNGITQGTSANTFSPDHNCKRGQIVTFLWRAAGCPEPTNSNSPFKDVQDPSAFYYKAVLWAVEEGITSGTSANTFSPDSTCTRSQVVTFLWRCEDKPAPSTTDSPFTDVQDTGMYYYPAVLWAVEEGITAGVTPDIFRPNGICKRGQIVTFLYRFL